MVFIVCGCRILRLCCVLCFDVLCCVACVVMCVVLLWWSMFVLFRCALCGVCVVLVRVLYCVLACALCYVMFRSVWCLFCVWFGVCDGVFGLLCVVCVGLF